MYLYEHEPLKFQSPPFLCIIVLTRWRGKYAGQRLYPLLDLIHRLRIIRCLLERAKDEQLSGSQKPCTHIIVPDEDRHGAYDRLQRRKRIR